MEKKEFQIQATSNLAPVVKKNRPEMFSSEWKIALSVSRYEYHLFGWESADVTVW